MKLTKRYVIDVPENLEHLTNETQIEFTVVIDLDFSREPGNNFAPDIHEISITEITPNIDEFHNVVRDYIDNLPTDELIGDN